MRSVLIIRRIWLSTVFRMQLLQLDVVGFRFTFTQLYEYGAYKLDNVASQVGQRRKGEYRGEEDCLYLNIYMMEKPEQIVKCRPVLVYIHGGAFHFGSGDFGDIMPDAIVQENLIFITINYRLGIFGFLNMNTPDCRGNAGLKDQVQALKWIRSNIHHFGGDPDNITITGHSAGATCVNLHLISPLSKGLFKRAIVKGGGIYCPWGYKGAHQKPKRLFREHSNMENELRNVLVQTLRKEKAIDLLRVSAIIERDLVEVNPRGLVIFCAPSLEKIKAGAFIPFEVEDMMRTATPVPTIAGITRLEGHVYITNQWKHFQNGFGALVNDDREFAHLLMRTLNWSRESAERHMNNLREKYFPRLSLLSKIQIQSCLARFMTDLWYYRFYDNFKIGEESERLLYFFQFTYLAKCDCLREHVNPDGTWNLIYATGAAHSDETNYLYDPEYLRQVSIGHLSLREQMRRVSNSLCKLWGSFCREGVPTQPNVEWESHTEENPRYLNIGQTPELIKSRLAGSRWADLKNIIDQEPTVQFPDMPEESIDFHTVANVVRRGRPQLDNARICFINGDFLQGIFDEDQ